MIYLEIFWHDRQTDILLLYIIGYRSYHDNKDIIYRVDIARTGRGVYLEILWHIVRMFLYCVAVVQGLCLK